MTYKALIYCPPGVSCRPDTLRPSPTYASTFFKFGCRWGSLLMTRSTIFLMTASWFELIAFSIASSWDFVVVSMEDCEVVVWDEFWG